MSNQSYNLILGYCTSGNLTDNDVACNAVTITQKMVVYNNNDTILLRSDYNIYIAQPMFGNVGLTAQKY